MSLPETVRVKLSSEAAGYVSVTPVVVREIPTRELVELMLGITGKDEARVRDLLLRGTLVSRASRFRWTGWDVEAETVRSLLATFPDPDPSRAFNRAQCTLAVLRGARHPIGIPREIGARRRPLARVLRSASFWELLMGIAAAGAPQYSGYSYREHGDVYHLPLAAAEANRLREAARLLRYSALEQQVRTAPIDGAELYVARG